MSAVVRAWCTCGWHGEYTSQARADFAARQHSCDRWLAKRAAARRGAERLRRIDRTPKPCRHEARHEHGTHTCYVLDGCRCGPCAAACSAYESQRHRDHAYGRPPLVDAGPVREHVAALARAGVGLKTLAAHSGVAHGALTKLVYGTPSLDRPPSARVRRETAEAILAVPVDGLATAADGAPIRATGTARRLRALVALGWSVARLSTVSGIDRQALDHVLDEAGDFWRLIQARHARAVRDLYERLWDTAPPQAGHRDKIAAARSRSRAAAAGWPPPAAWDDETIDDPEALPAPGWRGTPFGECVVPGCAQPRYQRSRKCLTHAFEGRRTTDRPRHAVELDLDDFAHLVRLGEHPERAAERIGVSVDAIAGTARRTGRDDVVRLLDQLEVSA